VFQHGLTEARFNEKGHRGQCPPPRPTCAGVAH